MKRNLPVSAERIGADIEALAAITEPDAPWTRRAFTPRFAEGRAWLTRRFAEAGLQVHVDAGGNLIGRLDGTDPGRGVIMLGSHSDTVPNGGRFDGIAGVVAALEVARALRDEGVSLAHDLEIVDFLAEEVSLFGVSCIGSRTMAGVRPADWLTRMHAGVTLAAAIDAVGGQAAAENAARTDVHAFLELHIEQGPVLEQEAQDLGLVSAIAGITRVEVEITGRADHAGTTPMSSRQDALVAAAELVGWVNREGRARAAVSNAHFTATVGEFDMLPNAGNVVPARVRLLIDARAERRADMDSFLEVLRDELDQPRDVEVVTRIVSDNPPTAMDDGLLAALEESCADLGASSRRMASGAGHDAAWMARIAPAAMLFTPCLGGRSHAPEEHAEIEDIALGAAVLRATVLRLDARSQTGGS